MTTSISTPSPVLIGLHGFAEVGKDTAARRLTSEHAFRQFAFADPVRAALLLLDPMLDGTTSLRMLVEAEGWDRAKRHRTHGPEVRRVMQVFATDVCRDMFGQDIWVDQGAAAIAADAALHGPAPIVLSDVRLPNEAEWILSHGGVVWKIDRPGVGPINGHRSEDGLPPELITETILNDASVQALNRRIDRALNDLLLSRDVATSTAVSA